MKTAMTIFVFTALCTIQSYAKDRECIRASNGTEICRGDRVLFLETNKNSYAIRQHLSCRPYGTDVVCRDFANNVFRLPFAELSETPFRSGGFLCQPNTFDSTGGCGGPSAIEATVTGFHSGRLVNVTIYHATGGLETIFESRDQLIPEDVFPVSKEPFCTEDGREFRVGQELTYKGLPARIKKIYSNGVARIEIKKSHYWSERWSYELLPYLNFLSSSVALPSCGK